MLDTPAFHFPSAFFECEFEECAMKQLLHLTVIVIGSMLLKIIQVFPNIAPLKNTIIFGISIFSI